MSYLYSIKDDEQIVVLDEEPPGELSIARGLFVPRSCTQMIDTSNVDITSSQLPCLCHIEITKTIINRTDNGLDYVFADVTDVIDSNVAVRDDVTVTPNQETVQTELPREGAQDDRIFVDDRFQSQRTKEIREELQGI
ncbi:hypothetical protein [Halocatena salina]|uniref:Uncharacterized protein n=1 Tax=Halocatena salina TaxID=2934340 RepID=A0A8U0A0J1_9EURY|nr:hypothetical protein [Halocatena salina]UPM42661.1 hypothetical protein MW046_11955 [Halocatena salina]